MIPFVIDFVQIMVAVDLLIVALNRIDIEAAL